MDEEPTGNTPPPKRPGTLWQWLMPLWLVTPGLFMIAVTTFIAHGTTDRATASRAILTGLYTGPIALLMCLYLSSKLTSSIRKDTSSNPWLTGIFWALCFSGLIALNMSIASAGCSKISRNAWRLEAPESPPATPP